MVSASTRSCSSSLQEAASEAWALTVIALIPATADDVLQMLAIGVLVDREIVVERQQTGRNDALRLEIVEPCHRLVLRHRPAAAPQASVRKGIEIEVTAADRARLEAIVADRNSPQKHVWRARVILATADGCGTAAVMRRAGVSKPSVWRWQERFMTERRRRPAARQDPAVTHPAAAQGRGRGRREAHAGTGAAR